jgi:hypothetical protein
MEYKKMKKEIKWMVINRDGRIVPNYFDTEVSARIYAGDNPNLSVKQIDVNKIKLWKK